MTRLTRRVSFGRFQLHKFAESLLQGTDAKIRFLQLGRVIICLDTKG